MKELKTTEKKEEQGQKMRNRGKKYVSAKEKVENKLYKTEEAIKLVKKMASKTAKFDQTVEAAMRLGVEPKYSDQMVRGYVVLPHGTGKKVRVAVITKGENLKKAEKAGADFVGEDDLIKKIEEGWTDFDAMVATPDVMGKVGKLGKILGPIGLMPSKKTGTLTFDIEIAVEELKAGKVEFKVDKAGNLHSGIGKVSFDINKIKENFISFINEVKRLRPTSAKGRYIKKIYLSATMTPSVKVDVSLFVKEGE